MGFGRDTIGGVGKPGEGGNFALQANLPRGECLKWSTCYESIPKNYNSILKNCKNFVRRLIIFILTPTIFFNVMGHLRFNIQIGEIFLFFPPFFWVFLLFFLRGWWAVSQGIKIIKVIILHADIGKGNDRYKGSKCMWWEKLRISHDFA